MSAIAETLDRLRTNVARVYLGSTRAVDLLLVSLLTGGHILVEDVPGIGKTTLIKAVARSLGLSFRRIQCTPDLLPSDITGSTFFDQRTGEWRFRPGPLLTQIVLVDEINRATPRTQSALLEAMEERQITVDGETHLCPSPFLVLATQNPVEQEGTFPLPEAQLDRFLIRLRLGYPDADEEAAMVWRHAAGSPLPDLQAVWTEHLIRELQEQVTQVRVSDVVLMYIVTLVRTTRSSGNIRLGASPRASLALHRASQAHALMRGRGYVLPDDVKAVAGSVLAHRLILNGPASLRGVSAEELIAEILADVPVPAEPLAKEV